MAREIYPGNGLSTAIAGVYLANPDMPRRHLELIALEMASRRHEVSLCAGPSDHVYVQDGDVCSLTIYVARICEYVDQWCRPRAAG